MRFKIILIAVALCMSANAFSQESETKLPDITPPSPEAFAMTKYADLQANEFNGMVNYSLPLYTYRAGHLELPITLNYMGAGVKVDDVPTWVGINWNLSAGGVITRTIKDKADEAATTREFLTDSQVTNYQINTVDGTTEAAFIKGLVFDTQKDTEVDIFSFSFAGFSGSFYLDKDWNAKLLKDDCNLKINVGNSAASDRAEFYNNKYIYITTPDGVLYTFGGANAIEETTQRYVVDGSMQPDTFQGPTAFYLISIEHPINGTILFQYLQNLPTEIVVNQKIQKVSKVIAYEDMGDCVPGTKTCTNSINVYNQTGSLITVSSRVVSPKYLSKIYSYNNSETINFISDRVDNANFKRVLNRILVDKDNILTNNINNDSYFKTIDLDYQGFQAAGTPAGYQDVSKRIFLHKVVFDIDNEIASNTQNGRRNEVFTFNYDGYNNLPPRFSFSQDYVGHYNGITNTTGIPAHPDFLPIGNAAPADRRPNFGSASSGALSRITYPAGGYTNFEYEASSKAKKKSYDILSLYAYRNQRIYSPPARWNKLNDGIPRLLEDGGVEGIVNTSSQEDVVDITVNLRAFLDSSHRYVRQDEEKATITIEKINGNGAVTYSYTDVIQMSQHSIPMNTVETVEKLKRYDISLLPGYSCRILINIFQGNGQDPVPMEAIVGLKYNQIYTVVDDLGVRLKKQTDFAKDDQPENVKRYYYSTIEKIHEEIDLNTLPVQGESTGYVKQDKNIVNFFCQPNVACNNPIYNPFMELYYQYLNIYSDRLNYSNTTKAKVFPNVTISYGGDDFEMGGVEKEFSLFDDYSANKIDTKNGGFERSMSASLVGEYPEVLDEYVFPSVLNGTLLKEKYFKKDGPIVKKVLEKKYIYTPLTSEKVNNIFGRKEFEAVKFVAPAEFNNTASNYTVGVYATVSQRYELTEKEVVEYVDPVPLYVLDESIYKKIVSNQRFLYGDLRGLPTQIVSSTSESVVNKTTRNYYANEATNFNLDQEYINGYNKLIAQNRISTPIQVENYSGSELLSKQLTLYKAWNSNANLVMPAKILSAKGANNLEERVLFLKYTPFGNPMDVSLSNGTVTRYYYNSHNKVMVKIENYLPPQGGSGGELPDDVPVEETGDNCDLHIQYPQSMVTTYLYNDNHQIIRIIDQNCLATHYEYDKLYRLKTIKDDDGNIIKEFDTNFRRY